MKNKKLLLILMCSLLFGCTDPVDPTPVDPVVYNPINPTEEHEKDDALDREEYDVSTVSISPDEIFSDDYEILEPFHTVIELDIFDSLKAKEAENILNDGIEKTHPYGDRDYTFKNTVSLKNVNESIGTKIEVGEDFYNLLKVSLEMCELTEGYFNPFMGNIIDLWEDLDLFSPSYMNSTGDDPEESKIKEALTHIPSYEEIKDVLVLDDDGKSVTFKQYNSLDTIISLGAIAKGFGMEYIGEQLNSLNREYMLSGGGSSLILHGLNPRRTSGFWGIGVTNPYNYGYMASIRLFGNYVVSSSGDYQKCFVNQDGTIRHHIINPFTGYSENYYRGITLVAKDRADVLDALSTAIYSIGSDEELVRIVHKVEKYYKIDIGVLYIKQIKDHNFELHATPNMIDITEVNTSDSTLTSFKLVEIEEN